MQLITAVVQPYRLDAIKNTLREAGIAGLTASEAVGYGAQGGHVEVYRSAEVAVDFVPKKRIEVLATDERAEQVVTLIADAARTGHIGDGKIWSVPVHNVIRVRTGEQGPEAI